MVMSACLFALNSGKCADGVSKVPTYLLKVACAAYKEGRGILFLFPSSY